MPTKQKLGLYAAVSNYQGKRIYDYCTTVKLFDIKPCWQQFITGVLAPDGGTGTCGCGTPCCGSGQVCMNDLGVDAYYSDCVVNGQPTLVYRLAFGYCIGTSGTQPYQSSNQIAQATISWYYGLSQDNIKFVNYDSLGSTGWNTYGGDNTTIFQNPNHSFQNCYIDYDSPTSVTMSEFTNCTNSSNPAYGPYDGGVPYC